MNAVTLSRGGQASNGDGRTAQSGFMPFAPFHRELNQLLDDVFDGFGFTSRHVSSAWPVVEVNEREDAFVVTADLPGVQAADVQLAFRDGVLTLKGERKSAPGASVYSERWAGSFEREVTLGSDIDPDQIHATARDGVLTVTLPKKPTSRPRRIPVE